jgi:hypothetical protein
MRGGDRPAVRPHGEPTRPRRAAGGLVVLALVLAAATWSGCRSEGPDAGCVRCHRGLELASASHPGCVPCHGGDPKGTTKTLAHRGLLGLSDASYPGRWEQGCGPCHRHQLERMASSQMFTNAGMIAQIQATWEGERPGAPYAARAATQFAPGGERFEQRSVAELDHLSGELFRKFCARCHLARQNESLDSTGHPAGCAACHFPFGEGSTYAGGDRTMRGRSPHSATHALQGLPPMSACTRCHQRSGRVALSYQGLSDANNALVPTRAGMPGPLRGSDDRSFTHIAPDVHFAAGLECIDCHTSREVMGEGYASPRLHGQLEIACEDCHGTGDARPRFRAVEREHELPLRESRQYGRRVHPGMRMALTRKDRPYSNVYEQDDSVMVILKRSGRVVRSPLVTGTPEHRIAGHQRLACATCHSRTVTQCYGCHTTYDKRETGWDFVQGVETPGFFSETEDVRTLSPFPLALGGDGRIVTVTPGCQTFVTVIEADGSRSREEAVARYRGKPQLRFAPFFSHNVGDRAVGCAPCHGDPAFLGFGQHAFERGAPRGTLLCEKNPAKSLDGFLAMDRGAVVSHAAITRDGARPLDADEVRRVFAVNLCLICHDTARDPIYRVPLDYHALDDSLHRRLLSAGR